MRRRDGDAGHRAHRDDGDPAARAAAAAVGGPGRLGAPQPVPLAGATRSSRSCSVSSSATSLYRPLRFVFVTGRWDIVRVNLKLFMVGRYPTTSCGGSPSPLVADRRCTGGLIAGLVAPRQVGAGTAPPPVRSGGPRSRPPRAALAAARRRLCSCSCSATTRRPVARPPRRGRRRRRRPGCVGAARPRPVDSVARARRRIVGLAAVAHRAVPLPVADRAGTTGAGSCSTSSSPSAGIVLCFPLGVLLALGRRSQAAADPGGVDGLHRARSAASRCSCCCCSPTSPSGSSSRADLAAVEARRAGDRRVHAVHRGLHGRDRARRPAVGAARAVRGGQGARPVAGPETFLIVLPAGAAQRDPGPDRSVHQPVQGHHAGRRGDGPVRPARRRRGRSRSSREFRGQGLIGETLAFVELLFWVGSYTMSRESQRLERKLGVGVR